MRHIILTLLVCLLGQKTHAQTGGYATIEMLYPSHGFISDSTMRMEPYNFGKARIVVWDNRFSFPTEERRFEKVRLSFNVGSERNPNFDVYGRWAGDFIVYDEPKAAADLSVRSDSLFWRDLPVLFIEVRSVAISP